MDGYNFIFTILSKYDYLLYLFYDIVYSIIACKELHEFIKNYQQKKTKSVGDYRGVIRKLVMVVFYSEDEFRHKRMFLTLYLVGIFHSVKRCLSNGII